jgi:hypothetical protein
MARKAKARKCTAEKVGNIKAKVERQHRLVVSFSVIPLARSNPQRYTKMCVASSIPEGDFTLVPTPKETLNWLKEPS